MSEKLAI
jgi:dynein heavy chain, axonemal